MVSKDCPECSLLDRKVPILPNLCSQLRSEAQFYDESTVTIQNIA